MLATLHDVVVALAVPYAAYWLRLGTLPELSGALSYYYIAFVLGALAGLGLFGLNRGSWRYASIEEISAIVKCAAFASVCGAGGAILSGSMEGFPRSMLVIGFGAMILMMAGPRILYRFIKDRGRTLNLTGKRDSIDAILLYGYGDASANFIRQSNRAVENPMLPIGILDDRPKHKGRLLYDIKVMGGIADLHRIVEQKRDAGWTLTKLIIAQPNLTPQEMSAIVDRAADAGLKTYRLPQYSDLVAADTALKPEQINIEDLLGRSHVDLDLQSIAGLFKGRRVLVTGAGGSIGSEICRQVAGFGPSHMALVDNGEFNLYRIDLDIRAAAPDVSFSTVLCDVRDRDEVNRVVATEKPDVIFHAAALKHVPLVEHNPLEGMKTNILGTRNVADAALSHGCDAFVMISTDKAVNPTNIMGASKRFAEAYCQYLDRTSDKTRFMTVRFGNVLGSAGSVVPLFTRQIAEGGPVTVTHPDIERYFMTIPEAVRLVIAASAHGLKAGADRGRIFVLEMGKPIKILDLAHRMIKLSGLRPNIDIAIEIVGLRPGEKLYEETLSGSEKLDATDSEWLHVASYRAVDGAALADALTAIGQAVRRFDEPAAVAALMTIVPELNRSGEGGAAAASPAPPTSLQAAQ
jgi:FlaA1/EpsC-like NDP-sugar epimerase